MPKKSKTPDIEWLAQPEDHDYPAAASYLNLTYHDDIVAKVEAALRQAPMKTFKAKDIFRASHLSLLGVSNSHVQKNIKKIKKGIPLSPVLLVRDARNGICIIADGYHRVCGVYHFNEDADIPCQIADLPA